MNQKTLHIVRKKMLEQRIPPFQKEIQNHKILKMKKNLKKEIIKEISNKSQIKSSI